MGDSNELLMLQRVAWRRIKLELYAYEETLWIAESERKYDTFVSLKMKFIEEVEAEGDQT